MPQQVPGMSPGAHASYPPGWHCVQRIASQRYHPVRPRLPQPSVGHLTSAHDACVGKVFGKDGSQTGQGLFIACRVG